MSDKTQQEPVIESDVPAQKQGKPQRDFGSNQARISQHGITAFNRFGATNQQNQALSGKIVNTTSPMRRGDHRWEMYAYIDRGEKHGVRRGQYVDFGEDRVGRVVSAFGTRSKVRYIFDHIDEQLPSRGASPCTIHDSRPQPAPKPVEAPAPAESIKEAPQEEVDTGSPSEGTSRARRMQISRWQRLYEQFHDIFLDLPERENTYSKGQITQLKTIVSKMVGLTKVIQPKNTFDDFVHEVMKNLYDVANKLKDKTNKSGRKVFGAQVKILRGAAAALGKRLPKYEH